MSKRELENNRRYTYSEINMVLKIITTQLYVTFVKKVLRTYSNPAKVPNNLDAHFFHRAIKTFYKQ